MVELRSLVDEYEDRVLIGESDRVAFLGDGSNALHMVFNFPLMNMGHLTPQKIYTNQQQRLDSIPAGGWQANTLGNHDRPRTIHAHSDGIHHQQLARSTLAALLTLRGTPFLYYGEEIGMVDVYLDDLAQIRDRVSLWAYVSGLEMGLPPGVALEKALRLGRDRNRTPMQWSTGPNAGFSPAGIRTWLPVHQNRLEGVNVADQQNDPQSLLNYYRRLIKIRNDTPALKSGEFKAVHLTAVDYLAYLRSLESGGEECIVVLNFSPKCYQLDFSDIAPEACCVFSTHKNPGDVQCLGSFTLVPFEVFIGLCSPGG
jgi:alpha-glucosidase